MVTSRVVRIASTAAIVVVWMLAQSPGVQSQQQGGTAQTVKVQPVNSGANPYRVIRDWARLDRRRARGRIQRRGHRPGWQDGVGDRSRSPGRHLAVSARW